MILPSRATIIQAFLVRYPAKDNEPPLNVRYKNMTFSFWHHYFDKSLEVKCSQEKCYSTLTRFYQNSSRTCRISEESPPDSFVIARGYVWISWICPGKETWCHHTIKVILKRIDPENTHISWSIDMHLFGFTFGPNFLLKECTEFKNQIEQDHPVNAATRRD